MNVKARAVEALLGLARAKYVCPNAAEYSPLFGGGPVNFTRELNVLNLDAVIPEFTFLGDYQHIAQVNFLHQDLSGLVIYFCTCHPRDKRPLLIEPIRLAASSSRERRSRGARSLTWV